MNNSDYSQRVRQAERIVSSIVAVEAQLATLRATLRATVTLPEMARLLIAGHVSADQFVQRLVDMGMTLDEARDYYLTLRNTDKSVATTELSQEVANRENVPWVARFHWPKKRTSKKPVLTPASHRVMDLRQQDGNIST